jgi:hypothetical protein
VNVEKWWDSVIGIVAGLRARRSGVQIPAGPRDSSLLQNVKSGSGADTAFYSMGTAASFPGGGLSGWVVRLNTPLHLVGRLRMIEAIPPYPLHAFIACTRTTLLHPLST